MKRRFLQTLLLDKRHNPGSKPKAVPDTPRCTRPCRVPSTHRVHRVDVEKKNRSRKALVRASGDAEDRSESSPHSRRGFMRGNWRCFWMPSRSVLGRNNETVHQGIAGKGQEGPQRDRRNGQTVGKALALSCRKIRNALLYKKSSPKKKP